MGAASSLHPYHPRATSLYRQRTNAYYNLSPIAAEERENGTIDIDLFLRTENPSRSGSAFGKSYLQKNSC